MTEIRTLRSEDDLCDLVTLSRTFFDEYEDHHEELFKIDCLSENDIVEYFSRSVDSPESETFIAVEDGRAVGYITVSVRAQPSFYRVKKVGVISGLMVHKDFRRKGIAAQLLAEATGFFKKNGVRYFTVYTLTNNHAAIELYKRNEMMPLHTTLIGEVDGTLVEVKNNNAS